MLAAEVVARLVLAPMVALVVAVMEVYPVILGQQTQAAVAVVHKAVLAARAAAQADQA